MKICANKNCIKHKNKERQEGSDCSYCHADLEEVAGGGNSFDFKGFFEKFSLRGINPKTLMIVGAVVMVLIIGYFVASSLNKPSKIGDYTEGVPVVTTDSEIIKSLNDYIKNERYDSVWAIVNRNKKEVLNVEKSTTVELNRAECDHSASWEIASSSGQLNINILPNNDDFNGWIKNGDYDKISKYITDEVFTGNDKPIQVKEWLLQLKSDKVKGEKLFILRSPINKKYHGVIVYDLAKSRPSTDIIAQFKSGWSLEKVEIKSEVKPEAKVQVESQIKGLSELVGFAQEGSFTDSDIQMIVGGVDISAVSVQVHSISGGSRTENMKTFLTGISISCKKCKIVPISCMPTESAYNGDSKNIYLKNIEFLQY